MVVETVRNYAVTEETAIEKIIHNEYVHINHVALGKGDALPIHAANSHAHLIVVRGAVTLALSDQEPHEYPSGRIVSVPYGTRMNVSNQGDAVLSFFIVKAPGPGFFTK